jgi:hypothetical protein
MEALQGPNAQEDNPTLVHLATYLLALENEYSWEGIRLGDSATKILLV